MVEATLNYDLYWGTRGLKISLTFLIIVILFLIFFLTARLEGGFLEILPIILRAPAGGLDIRAIIAGVLIFIAIPFTLGVHIGLGMGRKKKKK